MEQTASMNSITSRTTSLNIPIACLTLNAEGNKVIVSGRNEYELLHINDEKFVSRGVFNYHNSRPALVNIMDISWSRMDETLAVSCGFNGEVQKLIVGQNDLRVDGVIKFHEKTINKVHFHPGEGKQFITGCQDGSMKLIDFRIDNNTTPLTFQQEGRHRITDLQFNPFASSNYQFACGSESGLVSIWDTRNNEKCLKKYPAHLSLVHLDWHSEEKSWLATASRDKQICVWDVSGAENNNIFTLTHSEGVSSIKWRPKRKFQIAACSSGIEGHLYVWDLRRPYVPYASFDSLCNKVQNFLWRNDPKSLVATNKNKLVNLFMSDAIKPADNSKLITVEMDNYGALAFAFGVGDLSLNSDLKDKDLDHSLTFSENEYDKFRITKSILYFEHKIPIVKSDWFFYSSTNYKFKNGSFEELCDYNAKIAYEFEKFEVFKNWMILKTIYKDNDNYELKDEHNQHKIKLSPSTSKFVINGNKFVKDDFNQINALQTMTNTSDTSESNLSVGQNSTSPTDSSSDESAILESINQKPTPLSNTKDHQSLIVAGNNRSDLNINTAATTSTETTAVETKLSALYVTASVAAAESAILNATANELNIINNLDIMTDLDVNNYNLTNLSNQHLNKLEDEEDTSIIPNEIIEFNSMDDLVDFFNQDKQSTMLSSNYDYTHLHQNFNLLRFNPSNTTLSVNMGSTQQLQKHSTGAGTQYELGWLMNNSIKMFNENSINTEDRYNSNFPIENAKSNQNSSDSNKISNLISLLSKQTQSNELSEMNFDDYFKDLLLNYVNDENDLTTAIFMFLVASSNNKFKSKFDKTDLDEWFSQYIELLAKFELWNLRTDIIKTYNSDFIENMTQKSLIYNTMCADCKKTMIDNLVLCKGCRKNVSLCAYCNLPVNRLYAWCHNCCHGGHLDHMTKWFKNNTKCPTGCGCECAPNYQ